MVYNSSYRGSLEDEDSLALQTEIDILSQLDHPNVVKLFEIFEDKHCMYLVMEIMTGGEVKIYFLKSVIAAVRQNC